MTQKVDAWCCGVCLYRMMFGCFPHDWQNANERSTGMSLASALQAVKEPIRIPNHQGSGDKKIKTPGPLVSLLGKLLDINPESRFSVQVYS